MARYESDLDVYLTVIADYIVYIMEGAQIASPLLTASIQYIINVVLTLPAILYLDKWGRRPSMIIGSFFMMTWLFISGKTMRCSSTLRCLTLLQVPSSNTMASPTQQRQRQRATRISAGL